MQHTGRVTDRSRSQRLATWNRLSEWPLIAVSLAFLGAYSWEVLNVHMAPATHNLCEVVQDVAWAAFIVDYLWRLYLARNRWHYFSRHLLDLAIIALPMFRSLRLLRVLMLLRVLSRSAGASLRGQMAVYIAGTTSLLIYCGSLAILTAERGQPGAKIETFGDAVWWAVATVTTVGYGDYYPVTTQGRVIAAGLMVTGIALIGLVTASFATWIVARVQSETEQDVAATRRDLDTLAVQMKSVATQLARIEKQLIAAEKERAEKERVG